MALKIKLTFINVYPVNEGLSSFQVYEYDLSLCVNCTYVLGKKESLRDSPVT